MTAQPMRTEDVPDEILTAFCAAFWSISPTRVTRTHRDPARRALAAVIPAIRAQALAPVLAEHPRDDTNPHGPWCPTCTVPWPCRTVRAARGDA